jgi:hypothetical protein
MKKVVYFVALGALMLGSFTGCRRSSSSSGPIPIVEPPLFSIDDFIQGIVIPVNGVDIVGVVRDGLIPPPVAQAPALDALPAIIEAPRGSTPLIPLSALLPFSDIAIAVGGADSFQELNLGVSQNQVTAELTVAQQLPDDVDEFDCVIAAGDAAGFGIQQITKIKLVDVGTGEVQINVSWDVDSDLDLHVIEPSGERIFFANTVSQTGGQLDLDSNPACNIDGIRSENIFWDVGQAPQGSFQVLVDLFAKCGTGTTNFVVTLNVDGQTSTFSGAISVQGAQQSVVTFNR